MRYFTFLLIFMSTQLLSSVVINSKQSVYNDFSIGYIYDKNSQLSIEDVKDTAFKDVSNSFTFGYKNGTTWFKIEIKNLSEEEDYILSFSEAIWKNFDLYYKKDDGFEISKNGLDVPLNERAIQDVKPAFDINIAKNTTKVFYVQTKTIASQIGSFTILTKEQYYNPSKTTITDLYIVFSFILLIIALLNGYSYYLTKDNSYIYYILYILASILFSSMHSGSYLLLGFDGWNEGLHVVGTFVLLFLLLFSDIFLKLESNTPKVHKFFELSAIVFIIFSILIYNNIPYTSVLFNLYSSLFFTVLFYAVIKIFISGFKGAKFYLIALLIYAPLMGLMILTFNSFLDYSPLTRHLFLFGSLIEIIFFTLILTSKYRTIILEEMRAQEKLLVEKISAEEKANRSIALFGENVIASNTDLKGVITYASVALSKISGYSISELINQPHNILRHPDMPDKLFKDMWDTIKSGKVWEGEIKNRKKDGGYYWVRTTIMPEFNKDGKCIGYQSIRHDVTSQKAKEEFMANMSHELRTPLNAIMGFSRILFEKLDIPELKNLSKQINNSSKSLLGLINDILDLSKIQNSNFSLELYEFNAYKELVEFSEQLEGLASEKSVLYNGEFSDTTKAIFLGDWIRIRQIILNLISNAIKFTAKNGKVMSSIDYDAGNLIIKISDNGIGMSAEIQDKIFKPFEQADGSTTRKYGGTGLGLSIVQSLVELMHGKINLESQEGEGSTFQITIPLEKIKDEEFSEYLTDNEDEELEPLNAHVLVAEDNKTNQILISMLLEEFGITCDMANDGIEATNMYNPKKHKLILMDENMPNMNGIEAMKSIREKYGDDCTPIIALTANAMEGDKERFLNAGMDDFLTKPIDEKLLYKALKAHI